MSFYRVSIKPVHNSLQGVGASSVHGGLVSDYQESDKAYFSLSSVGASSVHDSILEPSGYQYILVTTSTQTVSATELMSTQDDDPAFTALYDVEEHSPSEDIGTTLPIGDTAFQASQDDVVLSVNLLFEDTQPSLEDSQEPTSIVAVDDLQISLDEGITTYSIHAEEYQASEDDFETFEFLEQFFSNKITILNTESRDWSTKTELVQLIDEDYSTQVSIVENNFVPVTNATSAENSFQATLAVNGEIIYEGVGTAPPTVAGTSILLSYKAVMVGAANSCDLLGLNFSLDNSGGNFNIVTQQEVGDLGRQIDIMGLLGTVTAKGRVATSGQVGFTTSGIFGSPMMNRQFLFITQGNALLDGIANKHHLRIADAKKWPTVSSAARAAVNQANAGAAQLRSIQGILTPQPPITFTWSAQDAPYNSTIQEAGLTLQDALGSLAQRVGATMRWSGSNAYTVAYPDRCYGNWEVPSCKLISANGMEFQELFDLETGLTGVGLLVVPTLFQYDRGTNTVPNPLQDKPESGGPVTVTQIAKITKKLTANDPPLVYDLPQDFDEVYIQILIPEGRGTGGNNLVSIRNFVTTNPQQWFNFNLGGGLTGAGIGGNKGYIFLTNIGGRYIPQVKVDHRLFPANPSVNAGNFVLSLACTRKDLRGPFKDAKKERENEMRDLLASEQDRYRFVKTYQGTINCFFFGSIPLPGMCAKAHNGLFEVSGIVEHVSFNYPGLLTVQVARYTRLDFMQPKLLMSATGGG